ncbi:hypothetical protein MAR_025221 [Mya arenaria]|uniref:Uncharacterized protein n=1 Tax=Mya arenaria TaxID=6604 RepID=A0ABY7DUT9_MYAAR|nr:hypothetical protein MAR_025221 [Mya arenaria]
MSVCMYVTCVMSVCMYVTRVMSMNMYVTHVMSVCMYVTSVMSVCMYVTHVMSVCMYVTRVMSVCMYVTHLMSVCMYVTRVMSVNIYVTCVMSVYIVHVCNSCYVSVHVCYLCLPLHHQLVCCLCGGVCGWQKVVWQTLELGERPYPELCGSAANIAPNYINEAFLTCADAVMSSRSWLLRPDAASTGSFSHGSSSPGPPCKPILTKEWQLVFIKNIWNWGRILCLSFLNSKVIPPPTDPETLTMVKNPSILNPGSTLLAREGFTTNVSMILNTICICGGIPASAVSRMMGDVRVMVHDTWGSMLLVTMMAASSTQRFTSYFSSVTV